MTTDSLLAWLGEASLVLGLVVVLVLLVRRAARGRLSASWTYALWLAVPAALLATLAPAGLVQLPAPAAPAWLPPQLELALPPLDIEPAAPGVGAAARRGATLGEVVLTVWLVGFALFLTAHMGAQLRFARAVIATARRPKSDEIGALADAAAGTQLAPVHDFRFTDRIGGPVACGLLRPLVVLPETFLARHTPLERRVIVLHETEHVRARHLLHRLLARLLRDLFWFHPLAWAAERALVADQELACDQAVLARDHAIRPRIYAAALLGAAGHVAEGATRAPAAASVPLVTLAHLKERTVMLARHASIGRTRAAGALVVGAVAALSVTAGLTACGTTPEAPLTAPQAAVTVLDARVLSPEVGEAVVAAQEKMAAEPADYAGALADLARALSMPGLTAYETGVALYMRGAAKYQLDDAEGALADWQRALAEGELAAGERLSLMYNSGQLALSEGRYAEAVDRLELWIDAGGEPSDSVHLNLVAAYVEIGDLERALGHARQAFDTAEPRQKRHYDTLNYLYTELGMHDERSALLDEMVQLYPEEKNVWLSMAANRFEAGREREAFDVLANMYLNGMMTTESEIMTVVGYYDHYEMPFLAARILEREMDAGRVARSRGNTEKLAQLEREAGE